MNDLKSVLRSTTVILLSVGLVGIWMGGCETKERKVQINKLLQEPADKTTQLTVSEALSLIHI